MIRRNLTLFLITLCACLGFSFAAIKLSNEASNANPVYVEVPNEIDGVAPKLSSSGAIQVALLLDTSGSMNGLIEQAKSQLWNILNTLSRIQKGNQEAELQIALYEYGNPSTTNSEFQIHQLSEFTTDMDLISEKLFSLSTNGGDEYCGAVIKKSLEDLEWNDNESMKMIYIAGNEAFTQGPIHYSEACAQAKSKGIVVNTIFCGNQSDGIRALWNNGAFAGGGDYINIAHNEATVYISTPYDDKIEKLNSQLNDTYIPYGDKGSEKQRNQRRQDTNASMYSRSNVADRISFKSSKKYKSEDWDLIDAYNKDKSILKSADIKSDKYKSMTIEDLEANIEAVSIERESVQKQIRALDNQRREYKASEAKKNKGGIKNSLQQSILKTIEMQAKKKGFVIKE